MKKSSKNNLDKLLIKTPKKGKVKKESLPKKAHIPRTSVKVKKSKVSKTLQYRIIAGLKSILKKLKGR